MQYGGIGGDGILERLATDHLPSHLLTILYNLHLLSSRQCGH